MKSINKTRKNKKGVSEVVAYVLLIVLAVSIASMVYAWLKQQPKILEEGQECPEGTKLVILNIEYNEGTNLTFDIQNRGLFTTNGFTIKMNNRRGENIGAFILNRSEMNILPGDTISYEKKWTLSKLKDINDKILGEPITYLTLQPWVKDKKTGKILICKESSSVELT
jgi:hypothetical protein